MKELSEPKRKQARVQALTYLTGGVGMMLFLMLYLGPRAQAERLAARAGGGRASAPTALVEGAVETHAGEPAQASTATEPAQASTATEPAQASTATEPAPSQPAPMAPSTAAAPSAPGAATAPDAAAATVAFPAATAARAPTVEPVPEPVQVTRFSTGNAALTAAQLVQVQRAAKRLLADPSLRATVRGHADRRGADNENTPLSDSRAQTVARALTRQGVDASRLDLEGAGSQHPLDTADTPAAYARNRRVEIEFHRKEAP